MLASGENLYLDDATLTTANAVDGVDAEPAPHNQPGRKKLSHGHLPSAGAHISLHTSFFASGTLLAA